MRYLAACVRNASFGLLLVGMFFSTSTPWASAGDAAAELRVDTSFEGASGVAGSIDQEKRSIRLDPTPRKDRGWPCWWFFKLSGIRPGETITLDVGEQPWATPDRAVMSTDRRLWRQTEPGTREGKRMIYRQKVEAAEAWFAWGPPFVAADAEDLLRRAAERCPAAHRFELCRSSEGRPVMALRVAEPGTAESPRYGIWIQARQHAWESGSSWVGCGLAEWLTSNDPRAVALRQKAEITFVPIMDVDNVAIGAGGKEQKPHDHNRDWSDTPRFPAVAAAQRKIRALDAAGRFDLYVDLHNPGRTDLAPMFFVAHRPVWPEEGWANLQRFLQAAREEITGPMPYRGLVRETGPSYDKLYERMSGRWVRLHTRPHVVSVCLETPWNHAQSTTEGYQSVGRELGLAIERFFRQSPRAKNDGLTFFGWSDQHVQTSGEAGHLLPAIDAMNALAGTKYPEKIGGEVAQPSFVFGCGDITEWPTVAARDAYNALVTQRLKIPAFDLVGNHDEGGQSPSPTITKWITARHGGLSYSFDRGGVHFVALYSKYDESLNNPAQPVAPEALAFLRADLAKVPRGMGVIVALHLCYDAITNRDALVDAMQGARILAVLGGHYHKATINRYREIPFIQLPSPAPNGDGEFMVIRLTADRLVALPWNYRQKKWSDDARKMLDAALPAATPKSSAAVR